MRPTQVQRLLGLNEPRQVGQKLGLLTGHHGISLRLLQGQLCRGGGGERVAPALPVTQLLPGSTTPSRCAAVGVVSGTGPQGTPTAPSQLCPGSPENAMAQPKVTQPRGTRWVRGGRLFPPLALLTSRRLRSAGCSRMERLSRYCHRGLSSGGSRRFSRRDRQGWHRLPAGEGSWVRAWDSGAPGQSFSHTQPRGVPGSAPAPAPPAGLCGGYRRPRPTHPGRGRWRRRRPARPSPGPARRAQRAGVRAGSWCGQEAATYRSLGWGSWARTGSRLPSSLRPVPALPAEVRSRTPSGDRTALLQAPLERAWRHLVAALGTAPGEGR